MARQEERGYPPAGERRGEALDFNILDVARLLSVTAGGALAIYGLSRRSTGGAAMAAAGGYLLYSGISGRMPFVPGADESVLVIHSVTIQKPIAEVYRFWRRFENLPRFMRHLEAVEDLGNGQSHWIARGPAGLPVEWHAEITIEAPNEQISWQSLPGGLVEHAGTVVFMQAPGERGTEVLVTLAYDAPGGRAGAALARLFGEDPEDTIREDLRRMKALLETGEIPTTAGQPHGRRSLKSRAAIRMMRETEPEATQRDVRFAT